MRAAPMTEPSSISATAVPKPHNLLTLIPAGQADTPGAGDLLEAVARLHAAGEDLPALHGATVECVERLFRGCAAALFVTSREPVVTTLCAAGPGWRTAEREGPSWLAPVSKGLAELVRADARVAGRLARGRDSHGPDLVLQPLYADEEQRHVLAVAWPCGAPSRAAELTTLDRLTPFLTAALRRAHLVAGWRHTTAALREAQAELVSAHSRRAAGAVASASAHDLNNALMVLLGLSDNLLASGHLDGRTRRDLESMQATMRGLTRLSEQLAFLARQPRPGEAATVSLQDLVAEAVGRVNGAGRRQTALRFRGLSEVGLVFAGSMDLAGTVAALVRLHANVPDAEVLVEDGSGEVLVVFDAPADQADPGSHSAAALPRAIGSGWRAPVLEACRQHARAHGWRLEVTQSTGGRRRVVLAVPVAHDGCGGRPPATTS